MISLSFKKYHPWLSWTLKTNLISFKNRYIKYHVIHRKNVGKKVKGWISKQVLRKQSSPNFPKNEYFLPPDTHTYVFRKIWSALFSCFLRFEIFSFPYLPTMHIFLKIVLHCLSLRGWNRFVAIHKFRT